MSERIGISITFFTQSEEDVVRVLEKLSAPITGFVLEGMKVHIGTLGDDDGEHTE